MNRNILLMAKDEIASLRHQNTILRAKVDTMEGMFGLLNAATIRADRGMMHPDVLYEIETELNKKKDSNV